LKHFLYLTNDRLIALVWQRGAIIARESFLAIDADSASAAQYIARYCNLPTYLITDLVEEDFRLDTVPHLSGSDAEAVLTRKLGQLYRATTLRHAIVQGREPEGRRDDKVLYHAIANMELVKPWLDLLEKNKVPLEGIYSSPVLSASLLKFLDVTSPHSLLVTVVPDFGLRQTYFQHRQVKFSRITPIVYDEGQSVGALIAAETNRTWQYLDSLRHFSGGEALEVCVLVHERDRAMIADAVRSYPLRQYRFLDIASVAKTIGLSSVPVSSHAEQVLVHTYAMSGMHNHFAEPPLRRFATFRRARIGLFGLTAAALLLGVAGTAFNFYQAGQISSRIEQRELASLNAEAEYLNIFNAMRAQKLASDVVRDASAFYVSYMRVPPAAPGALLRDVSLVLTEFPRVRLLQIVWTAQDNDKTVPAYTTMASSGTLEVTSSLKPEGDGATQVAPNINNENSTVWRGAKFHTAIIDAAITPFDGNFRATLAELERFTARLNTLPGVKAIIDRRPLDVETAAIISATGKRTGQNPEARFVVRVVWQASGA
jgi:hypothetical protein